MIGLQNGLYQVGLVEDGEEAIQTLAESHPIEGGDVALLHAADHVVCKLQHQRPAVVVVVVAIAGAPFTNDDGSSFADQMVLQVGNPCVYLALDAIDGADAAIVR